MDLKNVPRLHLKEANSSLAKFGYRHQQRNTRARTGKPYQYLGIEESEGIYHQQMKERLKQECSRRLRMILKSELRVRNKITAIGALAVPVLKYSFGVINWRTEEMKKTDTKTRKMLTMYKMHHPKADIDRLYVKRKEGGRGLVQVEAAYKVEIINIAEYLNTNYKTDQFVNIIKSYETTQTLV